jgi:hypothetical protein
LMKAQIEICVRRLQQGTNIVVGVRKCCPYNVVQVHPGRKKHVYIGRECT